jgi:chaperonin cofactor prefoldin
VFNESDCLSELEDKVKSAEKRVSSLLKQTKTLNQDLNELFAHYKRLEGSRSSTAAVILANESVCSFNGMAF